MKDMKGRYGRYALITGASSGIGEEFARQLAAEGLDLVLVARRKGRLDRIAKELRTRYHVDVRVAPVDLSLEDFMLELDPVINDLEIGLLVNNAGFATSGPFLETDAEKELEMLHVNARAPLVLTKALAPAMVGRGRGGIIFLASMAGMISLPYMANYAATKAYDLMLGEALWYELKGRGVDVLSLAPGAVKTEFGKVAEVGSGFGLMEPEKVVSKALRKLGRTPSFVPGSFFRAIAGSSRILTRKMLVRVAGSLWTRYIMRRKHVDCLEKRPEDECS
ncbi:MAG: SDR family oxidoreductase [Candidatus Thermoplasmatota archaeon]|nr:SDR family oxidoreductase [Candidatus Thermoplasmatota archaeon]